MVASNAPLLTYPPVKALPGTFVSTGVSVCKPPKEGPRAIAVGINWVDFQGVSVDINLANQNVGVNTLSQISTIYVDNSLCTHSFRIICPDTGFEVAAPALATGYFNIITNGLRILLVSSGFTVGDVSNIEILNFMVPQNNISENTLTLMQSIGSNGQIREFALGDLQASLTINAAVATTNQVLLPAGNWVVTSLSVSCYNYFNHNTTFVSCFTELLIFELGTLNTIVDTNIASWDGAEMRMKNGPFWQTTGIQFTNSIRAPLVATLIGTLADTGLLRINIGFSLLPV